MDLEQAKAAWQRQRAEPVERPVRERVADIKLMAAQAEQRFSRELRIQLWLGGLCLVFLATWFDRRLPLLSNIGLGVLMLCLALGLLSSRALKRRCRQTRPELARREFLEEQRGKILMRIQHLRRSMVALLPAGFSGFLLWLAAQPRFHARMLPAIGAVAAGYVAALCLLRRKIRRDLLPALAAIDQELFEVSQSLTRS